MTGKVLGVTFVIFAVLTAAVLHAQAEIARDVRLPPRYWIEWGGHFENLGGNDFHFLVFFDQSTPGDIGFTGSVWEYSNEVLGRHSIPAPGRS